MNLLDKIVIAALKEIFDDVEIYSSNDRKPKRKHKRVKRKRKNAEIITQKPEPIFTECEVIE